MQIGIQADTLRYQANDERLENDLRQEKSQALQNLEIRQREAEQSIQIKRQSMQLEQDQAQAIFERNQEGQDADNRRTMELFEMVQERKAERIAAEANREQNRITTSQAGSDKMVDTLAQIAAGSKDSEVAMEALRQLGNLRQSDVQAQSDAYIDSSKDSEDEKKI